MVVQIEKSVNYFDFQKVTVEDVKADQQYHMEQRSANLGSTAGSGVLLDFPEEPVIFDSDSLNTFQSGIDAINAFDGQGILSSVYTTSDQTGGNQLSIALTGARISGVVTTYVIILGKLFDNSLTYEIVEFENNKTEVTRNHYKEVTNIIFQNFRGNGDTTVDGYGSFDVGGRCLITEASSLKVGRDTVVSEQILRPDIRLRDFKAAVPGKLLSVVLQEALGSSNDVDDLNVNTTVASTRTFAAGDTTDLIYGQKFQMKGDNIQKVTLLMSLQSGSSWSGTLVVGLRKLQSSVSCPTDFLPDNEIGFDPDTVSLEELALDQADLQDRGFVLDSTPRLVDFVFSGTNLSNPSLSTLEEDQFYVLTIRRTGNTSTGTLVLQEATNSESDKRLTVFDNNVWTDVSSSTLWYRIRGDSVRIAGGIGYVRGDRVPSPKTETDNNGVTTQKFIEDINLVNTGEDSENYIVYDRVDDFSDIIKHPTTGDDQYSRKFSAPSVSVVEQSGAETLINAELDPIILARVRDRNSKSNPTITGTVSYPGLGIGNTFTVINPGSDLLTQNVVGSTLIPNTSKPTLKYRIIEQNTYTDLIGDVNGDGVINNDDLVRLDALDGYGADLTSGTVAAATQLAAVLAGSTSVPEILRADTSGNGDLTSLDYNILNLKITDGYAMPAGSSFTRVELKLEPIVDPINYLTTSAVSTLEIEAADPDLIDNVSFSTINYQINYIETWSDALVEILDLRRYVMTTFLDFDTGDLSASTENGGINSTFIPGDMYLTSNVKELDGTYHPLDYERNIVEIELPAGTTTGELNIFDLYVVGQMRFSDGTYVAATAINNNQVKFGVQISSYAKDLDGYDGDDGYFFADESIGTYLDHDTGILRINAKSIIYSPTLPQLRTRITVTVDLKKAGFKENLVTISSSELTNLLT